MKIKEASDGRLMFYCEGCERVHAVNESWSFNGDYDNPTFSPSVLVTMPYAEIVNSCHSFVRDGNIEYLSDCYHGLAGTTVALKDIQEWFK